MEKKPIEITASQEFRVNLNMSEQQARALDALVGYGGKAFVEKFLPVFYKEMGKHYMQPYEKGLMELFENIRTSVGSSLHKIDEAKKLFADSISLVK